MPGDDNPDTANDAQPPNACTSARWLQENHAAFAAVRRGLADAEEGRLSAGPDLVADATLADRLYD